VFARAPVMRRPLIAFATLLVGFAGFSTQALACRQLVPTTAQFAAYDVAVLAKVSGAERLVSPGWNTWRVSADRVSESDDWTGSTSYTFTVTLSSDGCGRTELPPVGEVWVLFFTGAQSGEVQDALPRAYLDHYDVALPDVR
jgi:hypothetical protein